MMAAPLSEHLDSIASSLHKASRLLLCCDFDGTLVPIRNRPESCSLVPEVQMVLSELSRVGRVDMAIVSGRSLADLRSHICLDNVAMAGNHGLEIESVVESFRHPDALACAPALQAIIHLLRRELNPFHGVWVEDKGLSASIHFRLAEPTKVPLVLNRIDQIMRQADDANAFVLRTGKAVREIRPSVNWDKGSAIRWLVDRLSSEGLPTLPVYLGDDETDEDAFRAIATTGIGIRVGDHSTTAARYTIPDQKSIHQFLKWFASMVSIMKEIDTTSTRAIL